MTGYRPPVERITSALGAAGLGSALSWSASPATDEHVVEDLLRGFGRFVADAILPTDRIGDRHPPTLDPASGEVQVPVDVRKAFGQYASDGWVGLTAAPTHGGGGLPAMVGAAVEEMFAAANLALSLNPMLTQGAIHLLERWGSSEQRAEMLPALVQGRWTGTMCLTEADAGSDVGAVRTRARPLDEERWAITGTKIFITWGEHDLAENIVHLVLARTPGAATGTKGISLFAVPRDNGEGRRNGVRCIGLEEKLGIHGSPTCVIEMDDAVGTLVGPVGAGMTAMFTMMNAARRSIGLQGLAVAERAYQQAVAYARERRQGQRGADRTVVPIVAHPDVRRMLLLLASGVDSMRALLYETAHAADAAAGSGEGAAREEAQRRVDLLTPIAKAWSTDEGVRLASTALQVHGGAGYIEETGVAQRYRDARIAPIYEGTNGIQSIDLVMRKIRRDGGVAARELLFSLRSHVEGFPVGDAEAIAVGRSLDTFERLVEWVVTATDDDALAGASAVLDVAALAIMGALFAREVRWVRQNRPEAEALALEGRFRFFCGERLALVPGLAARARGGVARLDESFLT